MIQRRNFLATLAAIGLTPLLPKYDTIVINGLPGAESLIDKARRLFRTNAEALRAAGIVKVLDGGLWVYKAEWDTPTFNFRKRSEYIKRCKENGHRIEWHFAIGFHGPSQFFRNLWFFTDVGIPPYGATLPYCLDDVAVKLFREARCADGCS